MKSDTLNQIKDNNQTEEASAQGRKYWRSLDELAETPGFRSWLDREFPKGASELEGVDRRHFLKIMAASFAFAGVGLAGCREPKQTILPYSKQPERMVPGVPIYYTTSMPGAQDNVPLIVETHDARPTKIEGNPSYPEYNGATDGFAQASILDLYDPDRSQANLDRSGNQLSKGAVLDLLNSVRTQFSKNNGKGLAFLAEPSTSPSRQRLVEQLLQEYPEAVFTEYTPLTSDSREKVLGRHLHFDDFSSSEEPATHVRPQYDFTAAKRVISIDSDFLHNESGHLKNSRDFAKARRVKSSKEASKMNRLYMAESNFTITGGMADHRLRLPSSHMKAFTHLLAAEVFELAGWESDITTYLRSKAKGFEFNPSWVKECAKDLFDYRKQSLVIPGPSLENDTYFLVMAINHALQAVDNTIRFVEVTNPKSKNLADLAKHIRSGKVDTLVILGGNPAYNAPAEFKWAELQKTIKQVIRLGYHFDETSKLADYHLSANHYLESWGDGRTFDGTYVPVQPMILPLFEGFSELELLARLSGDDSPEPYQMVRDSFESLNPAISFEEWLSVGVLKNSAFSDITLDFNPTSLRKFILHSETSSAPKLSEKNLEVCLVPSNQVWDGRYANNGWLQECPDPFTKLTWDNAISISPLLAKELAETTGLPLIPETNMMNETGQLQTNANKFDRGKQQSFMAELTVNGKSIKAPLHIQPGLADYTVIIPVGFGRTEVGRVGLGSGFNAYPLSGFDISTPLVGGQLNVTEEVYALANTQEHWSLEGRAILREGNVDDYKNDPDFVSKMGAESHSPPIYREKKNISVSEKAKQVPRGNSLYETPEFKSPQQWGMSIDLNTCTGCNACVVACQSENNIPVIGKDQVLRGREMHWIRLDRYYSSAQEDATEIPQDPQVSFMSMLCQHCELAPCENVCPVNATVHDEAGLNVMAYNRCVGTRYCANNCPYKVRRFNFFDWNKRQDGHYYKGPLGPAGVPELHQMQKNPDVTLRMRGVMEKCTFCVQRIEAAKINQRVKAKDSPNVLVPEGTIKVACQQVCPTDSIVFGDVANPNSEVAKLKESDLNYSVLGYLNTRPRTTYLAKLRNPNPEMPDFYISPKSRLEYKKRYGHDVHHHESEITHN